MLDKFKDRAGGITHDGVKSFAWPSESLLLQRGEWVLVFSYLNKIIKTRKNYYYIHNSMICDLHLALLILKYMFFCLARAWDLLVILFNKSWIRHYKVSVVWDLITERFFQAPGLRTVYFKRVFSCSINNNI